jgi:glutamyl-Q tRNA(Asp) synthetase
VSVVTRGVDLFRASHVHRLLQALLGLPVPRWHHHGVLVGQTGASWPSGAGCRIGRTQAGRGGWGGLGPAAEGWML